MPGRGGKFYHTEQSLLIDQFNKAISKLIWYKIRIFGQIVEASSVYWSLFGISAQYLGKIALSRTNMY